MKFTSSLCLTAVVVMLTGAAFSSFATEQEHQDGAGRVQYLRITGDPSPIRSERDSKAPTIRLTKKGEFLEILSCAELWCKVKVRTKTQVDNSNASKDKDAKPVFIEREEDGYIPRSAGEVVDRKSGLGITLVLYIILLLGGAGAVVVYIRKQQQTLSR